MFVKFVSSFRTQDATIEPEGRPTRNINKVNHAAKKLFVGGLSWGTTEEGLRNAFAAVGTVESAVVITDKFSGKSKGFGFVEMSSDDEAAKAVEALNGKELDGRTLTVSEARPMTERPARD